MTTPTTLVRLPAALLALVTALLTSLVLAAPAHAAVADPVTDIEVTQKQGPNHTWEVTATWAANPDASRYRVRVETKDDGTGSTFVFGDADTTSKTLSTGLLAAGQQYWVTVRTLSGSDEGDLAAAPFTAMTLDTTGPTGTTSLDRSLGYLVFDEDALFSFNPDELMAARFRLTLSNVADNVSAPGKVKRQVVAGDGTAAKQWTTGSYVLKYTKAGRYTPHVLLTDEAGNTTDITVGTVRVFEDNVKPQVRIIKPKKPGKVSSWTRVKGTATDSASDVQMALAMVAQKRGGVWHVYDFDKKIWRAGTSSVKKSLNKSKSMPAFMMLGPGGSWRTPKIKGLTRDNLHVEAAAVDGAANFGLAKLNQRLS